MLKKSDQLKFIDFFCRFLLSSSILLNFYEQNYFTFLFHRFVRLLSI